MTELKDRIAQRYNASDRTQIEIPEWGDDNGPLKASFTKLTLIQASETMSAAGGDPILASAYVVALKLFDEKGEDRLFNMADAQFLAEEADPVVLMRLSMAINPTAFTQQMIDDAEGKSKPIPSSG